MFIEDDIGDDAHRKLDEELVSDDPILEGPRAPPEVYLLTKVVSQNTELFDMKYCVHGTARSFLEHNPDVKELLRRAWVDRSFKIIRLLSESPVIA